MLFNWCKIDTIDRDGQRSSLYDPRIGPAASGPHTLLAYQDDNRTLTTDISLPRLIKAAHCPLTALFFRLALTVGLWPSARRAGPAPRYATRRGRR